DSRCRPNSEHRLTEKPMWSDLMHRLRSLFRRKTVETELDEEVRFHIENQAEKHLRSGMNRDEAERRARFEFGGVDQMKEECRDARGTSSLETVIQDLRYSVRVFRRSKLFFIGAVLTVALGVGANGAVFSILEAVLLRPLPYRSPEDIVMV